MRITVLTLFPELIAPYWGGSILGRAAAADLVRIEARNLRDFTHDRHRTVDDTPYGGGAGMVLKPEPVFEALDSIREPASRVVLLSPQGWPFRQEMARRLSTVPHLVLIAGHYEGFDERIRGLVDEELSIGDYVLTGGELAALVVIDSVVRLLPGVIDPQSLEEESFSAGLLEGPQFTRPRSFAGQEVPEILLSGDHGRIARWRRTQGLRRTWQRRPELLADLELSAEERQLIEHWENEARL